MYKFRNLDINNEYVDETELPTEALNWNGHWLDKEVSGYRTLVTTGRHEYTRQITSTNLVGDGALYINSRLEPRKIEVTFSLNTNKIEDYNASLNQLEAILLDPQKSFYFADSPDYHFVGTVSEISLDKPTLSTTGKIVITSSDPYEYGKEKDVSGSGNSIAVRDDELTACQVPKALSFTPDTTVSDLTFSCDSKAIKLTIGAPAGQEVLVDFDKLNLSINDVDSLMGLSLESNLSDFYIKNGSTIKINASGTYKLTYEVKRL